MIGMADHNKSITIVPLGACIFLEIPESGEDCSMSNCIQCQSRGRYLTGDSLNDFGSPGHIICIIVWGITLLTAFGGVVGNLFIAHVLRRQKHRSSFDIFLTVLAWNDMLCCVFSLTTSTSIVLYYGNTSRSIVTLYTYFWEYIACMYFKSCATFLTVAIALERYLLIAFPNRCRFFTTTKTWFTVAGVSIFSFLLSVPRYLTNQIIENTQFIDIPTTSSTRYLIIASPQHEFWYGTLNGFFNQIDFWLPLPLLLILNSLIYYQVRKFSVQRSVTSPRAQRREIRAVRMFIPVVIVHLISHSVPVVGLAMVYHLRVTYRELYSVMYLAFAFNSAANLPIYYSKGQGFRKESKEALRQMFPGSGNWFGKSQYEVSNTLAVESNTSNKL